jgi:hypothetical protein
MMSENLFSPEEEAKIRLLNLGNADNGDGLDRNNYDVENGGVEGVARGQGEGSRSRRRSR